MSIAELLRDVTTHYVARGFPGTAIVALHSKIFSSLSGDVLKFSGVYNYETPVASLAGKFTLEHRKSYATATKPNVIFAFSFGYRVKARQAPGEERRLPGVNNRALAEIAARLKLATVLPIYAQFEIADALDDYTVVNADYSSPAQDMGTGKAVDYFKDHAKEQTFTINTAIVVAHRHHMDRCILTLRDKGVQGIPCQESYEGYDQKEAQLRVVSPEEFIISDFISMAARK
jgi:hypothetical protein